MAFDNNKLGELRPNQIITTFGPGSIVDAVKDSVTVLDTNYWAEKFHTPPRRSRRNTKSWPRNPGPRPGTPARPWSS